MAVPGSSDNAVFNGTSLSNLCLIDMVAAGGTQQVGSITLNANQGANLTIRNSSSTTNGTLVLNGVGGILLSNDYTIGGELIIGSTTAGLNTGLGLAASGTIYASGTLVASSDPGRIEIYSTISDIGGSRSITLTGPGNVYLRGSNTYSGDTIILNGALELDALGSPGNGAGTIYLSGGNIQCGASRNGYNTGSFIPNPIVLTVDAHIFNTASTANSTRYIPFSGSLGGSAGTLIICNPTTVSGNYFIPRFSGSFTFNRPVVIGDTSGGAFSDNTLSFSVVDMCNASTNGVQIWNGTFSGPGSLRRRSPILDNSVPGGIAILTGNNTYSGGTTISSGTLFANNTAGSALGSGVVTVTSLGTLAGNGAVIAPTIVSLGGTIQPGSTYTNVGNLAVNSLTIGPGANYIWQISSVTGTAGTAWDLITCNSGWTDAGSSGNTNVIHLKSLGVPTGWNKATAYTWLIISNNPANSPGFNSNNWVVDTTGFFGVAAGSFTLSTDANGSLDLVYTPIPNSNPVAHMLILAPGESATFGSAPGKTGSPSAQHSTVGYSVTVDALDANYNLCSNSLDTVVVTSSSGGDTLPANAALMHGTITFQVANNTAGSTTLTATNVTEGPAVLTGSSTVPVNINGTTTTLASSINPAAEGVPVAFTATVSSSAATRTGTVTFMKNGTTVLGTATLSGNTAALTLSGGTGTNSITAIYNGDANNTGSTSGALSQVIKPGGGVVVVGSAALMEDGQDYAATASTPITGRGPWVCGGGTGSSSFIKILAGDLLGATSPDIKPLPNAVNPAAKLQISKAGTSSRWYFRSMSNNVTSGSAYFSLLLNVSLNPITADEFMGTMISSTITNTPAPTDPLSLHARVGADGTHFDLGVQRLNGDPAWTGDLADNITYLVVLKYTFGPAATCSLYVNPIPGGTEPAPTVSATSDGVTPEPPNIGTVLFYEAGSAVTYLTSGTYNYDVMRADNNWANVTPSTSGSVLGATKLTFTPASQNIQVNQNSALISVNLLQSNATFNATADTLVALSSTSGGGTFLSGVDGMTVINSVTVSNGISSATFYYKDSVAGNPTITGASGLLTSATQSETVNGTTPNTPPNFPPGGVIRLPNGNISLTVTGAVNTPYRLWATTNIALSPVTNTWTLLQSGTITASPFTNYDLTATNFSSRFYLFSTP
jgi:autotransporter-associated beta strand protein